MTSSKTRHAHDHMSAGVLYPAPISTCGSIDLRMNKAKAELENECRYCRGPAHDHMSAGMLCPAPSSTWRHGMQV